MEVKYSIDLSLFMNQPKLSYLPWLMAQFVVYRCSEKISVTIPVIFKVYMLLLYIG